MQDLEDEMNDGDGVAQCTHFFVAMVEVVLGTGSWVVGGALEAFVARNWEDVCEGEEYVRAEWVSAWRKLQRFLKGCGLLEGEVGGERFGGWNRGRGGLGYSGIEWHSRSVSAPPVRRMRSPELGLIPVARRVVSPARMPVVNTLEEVDVLAVNQEKLANELLDVKREVRMLQMGFS